MNDFRTLSANETNRSIAPGNSKKLTYLNINPGPRQIVNDVKQVPLGFQRTLSTFRELPFWAAP